MDNASYCTNSSNQSLKVTSFLTSVVIGIALMDQKPTTVLVGNIVFYSIFCIFGIKDLLPPVLPALALSNFWVQLSSSSSSHISCPHVFLHPVFPPYPRSTSHTRSLNLRHSSALIQNMPSLRSLTCTYSLQSL